eukprot:CAMPEP_0180296904 /NCGR_PEP_ID=MMETSP0988-20121125/20008_1 /TAXON_ID=697907 /ORGANISM="non described non described, Strain CCMP2293" /LENGTH=37 /DNA_ID= /DNA_START= /DNA_END= /DNA_ORIENTATION=
MRQPAESRAREQETTVHDTRLGSREDVRALGYEVSYG